MEIAARRYLDVQRRNYRFEATFSCTAVVRAYENLWGYVESLQNVGIQATV